MSDYTWLRCGTRWHAFVRANLHPSARSTSVCRQARGYRTYPASDEAPDNNVCGNCLRVVERARVAAQPAQRLVSSAEMRECRRADVLAELEAAPPEPEVFLDRTRVPALLSVEEVQEAVLAEVSAHVPKASSQRLTTLVASRIAVRELRDELKAIEEGLSKRFVLAHRKLDALEQVFEALAKEIAP